MSVDNIHAFIFVHPLYGYLYHTEGIEHFDTTKTQYTEQVEAKTGDIRSITEKAENPTKSRQNQIN